MTGNFTFNNTIFAELDFSGVTGQLGLGFYRLIAVVKASMHGRGQEETISVSDLTAELSIRGAGNLEHYVGRMWQQGAGERLTASQYAWTPSVLLEVDLDARRLEAIESVRVGGSLDLKLWLYGRAVTSSGRAESVRADLYCTANQSSWIAALGQMGYRKTLLLEIPMPAEGTNEQLGQAAAHLREAQDLLLHGRYSDSIARCRLVCDSLAPVLDDAAGLPASGPSDWFQRQREMTKKERVRLVRRALTVLTHPAHHADQVSTQHEWGPDDAASILAATAALVRLARQS